MQTIQKQILLVVLFSLNAFLFSCKKGGGSIQVPIEKEINPNLIYRIPQTDQEKLLIVNLQKATAIIKDVYKDSEALKVVNIAIQSKIYTDQSIKLRDLIYPNEGLLATSVKYKQLTESKNVKTESFANAFWAIASKLNDASFPDFYRH